MSDSRIDRIETRWSLLRQAHGRSLSGDPAAARGALVMRYAPALRRYIGKIVADPEDADELAQDVIVRLMQGDFGGADPSRGRFRDLLKTAVRNMIYHYWAKQKRRKVTDADLSVWPAEDDRDAVWLAAWRKQVLDQAMYALGSEDSGPKSPHAILKLRAGNPEASSEELARELASRLNEPVRADAFRQLLRRARFRLAECLVEEIRNGIEEDTADRVLEELAALELLDHIRDFLPQDYRENGKLLLD